LVGELEARTRWCLFRAVGDERAGPTLPSNLDPPGVAVPFEAISENRSRYSVRDLRLAVSTTSRSSGIRTAGAGAPTASVGFGSPSGFAARPRRLPKEPTTLMRFFAPSATSAWRSTSPGRPTRFVPPSGFLTLLTGSSLHHLPATKAGTARGVHPSEPFPPAEPHAFRRQLPSCRF
jgi:hypothetical protein